MKNMDIIKLKKNLGKAQIISAITWAAVMLICSYLLRGSEHGQNVTMVLIMGATFNMLTILSIQKRIGVDKSQC